MANLIDALIYATIDNNTTSPTELNSILTVDPDLPTQTNTQLNTALNNILSETTLKRACCLANPKGQINVKIPIPSGTQIGSGLPIDLVYNKFDYVTKTITIPQNLCPTGYNRFTSPNDPTTLSNCDTFYKTYCTNIYDDYSAGLKASGTSFDPTEFNNFSPDCPCYVPASVYGLSNVGLNIIPSCFYPNCNLGAFNDGLIWADSASRGSPTCDITLCTDQTVLNNITAGGNINIINNVEQLCGQEVLATTKPPSTTTSAPPSTTTSAPVSVPTSVSSTTSVPTTSVPTSAITSSATSVTQLL